MNIAMKRVVLAALVVGLTSIAGCSGSADDDAADRADSPSVTVSSTQAATPSSTASTPDPGAGSISFDCYSGAGYDTKGTYRIYPKGGLLDFRALWATNPQSCDIRADAVMATTDAEKAAYAVSGYDNGGSIKTLYMICAENDPDDVRAQPGFTLSSSQAKEVQAALMLCPGLPQAPLWNAALGDAAVNTELEASGQRFGNGTHLVHAEIAPGTYVIEGEIEGCYWSRQDSSGNTIDNDFIPTARRVQVTIDQSDYAFDSEGCGTWSPAS